MTLHKIKSLIDNFEAVKFGSKCFEIRRNDRDYKFGDEVLLEEYDGKHYTGRILHRKITFIQHGGEYGLHKDYVVFAIEAL